MSRRADAIRRAVHPLARYLRRTCPSDRPVHVRVCRCRLVYGDCERAATAYRIRVNDDQDVDSAVGTLLHEWAHALSYGLDGDEEHGAFFEAAERLVFEAYHDRDRG